MHNKKSFVICNSVGLQQRTLLLSPLFFFFFLLQLSNIRWLIGRNIYCVYDFSIPWFTAIRLGKIYYEIRLSKCITTLVL